MKNKQTNLTNRICAVCEEQMVEQSCTERLKDFLK